MEKWQVIFLSSINYDWHRLIGSRYFYHAIYYLLLLIVGKMNKAEIYGNKKHAFNKVNMVNGNFVFNYHF